MKILFINPSLRLEAPNKYLPVGLGAVMTYVDRMGDYQIELLDIDINAYDDDTVEKIVSESDHDVFLSGSIVTHYKWMKWLTRIIRKYHPTKKIIIGNSVAGSVPELFLTHSCADVAVVGEGEVTTLEVLNAYRDDRSLEGIPGIVYRDPVRGITKSPIRTAKKHIDDYPFIDWSFFDTDQYFIKSKGSALGTNPAFEGELRVMPISTARGCVFRCTFCHFVFLDDPYRYRSPENILLEIRQNQDLYGANFFAFWDDLSFGSLRQTERLMDAIIESGLTFSWTAAVRVDLLGNPKYPYERRLSLAKKMKDAGCVNLGFSLESGSQEVLDLMEKRINPEYFIDQIEILDKVGIASSTSVVFGYPNETLKTIDETFQMALRSGVYPSMGYLLPLPRTKMYEYARGNHLIADENKFLDSITERQDLCINMTQLETDEILGAIEQGAATLNEAFKLGLDGKSLIKTGGYRKHSTKNKKENKFVKSRSLKRNQNDFSFNYSQAVFKKSEHQS